MSCQSCNEVTRDLMVMGQYLTRNKYCSPYTMELIVSTGFQSSRKMFKQTLPSRSMFGWYTGVSHFTFGGSCG